MSQGGLHRRRKRERANKGMKLTKLSATPTLAPQAALGRRCRLMPALVSSMDAGTASQLIPGVRQTRGGRGQGGGHRSMRRGILSLAVVLLGTGHVSAGDEAELKGVRVRLETAGPTRLVGVVAGADATFLMIQSNPQGDISRVARAEIRGLEVSRGFRRHTVLGLVGGALAWAAVVGVYATLDTLDESGVGEPLFVGGMVAAGGLVGTLVKTERWERVAASAVSLGVSPHGRGVRVEVALRF